MLMMSIGNGGNNRRPTGPLGSFGRPQSSRTRTMSKSRLNPRIANHALNHKTPRHLREGRGVQFEI